MNTRLHIAMQELERCEHMVENRATLLRLSLGKPTRMHNYETETVRRQRRLEQAHEKRNAAKERLQKLSI